MKKILAFVLTVCLFLSCGTNVLALSGTKSRADSLDTYSSAEIEFDYDVKSAYLMEASTGKVLFAKNEFSAASIASVTKVMTLLLVCEALEAGKYKLEDIVTVSAKAASMGGSQVFLEEGESISVEDLIKSTVIASGNDSSVALAELTAGSETAFVKLMNKRATELGLNNTNFENTTGLDDTTTKHYSCASDIAKISRELIKHEIILKYSSIWQDTIRNGEFTLTNTNRLVRYYDGCNGLKTGSTDKAGYCISATAKRGNMQLIAVVIGAATRDERNNAAKALFDYAFANYSLYEVPESFVENIDVLAGTKNSVEAYSKGFSVIVEKDKISRIEMVYDIPENLVAPLKKSAIVGSIIYKMDGEQLGKSEIYINESIEKIKIGELFLRILKRISCG